MDVTVITADIVRSREEPGYIRDLPSKLGGLTHPLLITPFSISRGDEIQAVCRGVLEAPELVRWLRYVCRPLKLRVGLGVGDIESGRESTSSWDMNGSAFIRAREALERLKQPRGGKTPRARDSSTARITSVSSGDPVADYIAQAMFGLIDAIQARWTSEQWEAVHKYELLGTYKAAGEALGIAFQNVQKRCRNARWTQVREAELALKALGELLKREYSSSPG